MEIFFEKLDTDKKDGSEEIDHEDKSEEADHSEDGYKFYYNKKSTEHQKVLAPAGIRILKKDVLNHKENRHNIELTEVERNEIEVDRIKKRITEFGKKRELNLEKRFVDDDNIYLLPSKIFEQFKREFDLPQGSCGYHQHNQIWIDNKDGISRENNERMISWCLQHEIVHSACKKRFFLRKEVDEEGVFEYGAKGLNSGYAGDNNFRHFNEGLTEITNQQIYFENDDLAPTISYEEEIIFTTELIKDISKKTERSPEEILSNFQKGMFEGERKYLKIIKNVYGKEAIVKIKNLENVDDIIDTAKSLKLSEAVKKIKAFNNGKQVGVNIADHSCHIQQKNKQTANKLKRILKKVCNSLTQKLQPKNLK